ncbi:MAG TPA: MobF family relaxase [Solirubrobacteraceae bacterium]|nr:MobF family relaxase [Solirubrobacteraceae bacterium]
MVSIGKILGTPASERYYTHTVADGREDYYAGTGEAPGEWYGAGATQLGLTGTVDAEEFSSLFRGVAPSGERLRQEPDERSVIGFDVTFASPKSVSILYGIGDDDVSRAAREAHDDAVKQALGYLESQACFTRRGRGGAQTVQGEGLAVGLFRHRTSRAGDPHLHTHAVVANTTQADGRWSTLDGRAIYAHARTAGFVYQAALRDNLSRELGVEWEPVQRGVADIRGIDRDLIEHLSRRRQEIVAYLDEHGARSAKAAQIAALETRRRKEYDVPVDRLRADWRAMAGEHGFGRDERAAVLHRSPEERRHVPEPSAAHLSSPEGVTRETSTFDRRAVIRAWAEQHTDGAPVEELERLADSWLSTPAAVRLSSGAHAWLGLRYSTPDMLATEQALMASGERRKGEGAGIADKPDVEQAIKRRPLIAGEQAAMVEQLTTSGDGIQVVRAAAGTGKTYALEAAREAWEASGHRVYGCALSARAAIELETQAGIDSTTIARLKLDFDAGHALVPNNVLVVDEAGMVGSRDLRRLADEAEAVGAKLVLVGDDHQLPEIEAGGAFRGLAERLGACELHQTRRQQHEWDRGALAALRGGGVDEWASKYRDANRIVAAATADEVRRQLVADWWESAKDERLDAVMVAHRRSDVAELNDRARLLMGEDGRLGADRLQAGRREFAVGDRVIGRHNDRRTGIINGSRGDVTAIDTERRTVTVQLRDGAEVTVKTDYLDAGHLDHGYAFTAHAAQGATVDRAFVLGSDDLYREWGYTALTRHRDEARFYLVSPSSTEQTLPGLKPEGDREDPVLEELRDILGKSHQKTLAIDNRGAGLQRALEEDELLDRYRLLRAEEQRAAERRATAQAAADEARRRSADLDAERAALSRFQRRRAAELDRQLATHRAAADSWTTAAEEATDRLSEVRAQRELWVDEHAPQLRAVISRQQARSGPDDTHADLLRQALANPDTSLPARPEGVTARESWAHAAASRAHAREAPAVGLDVADAGMDFGP